MAFQAMGGKDAKRMITLAGLDNNMTTLKTWDIMKTQGEARMKLTHTRLTRELKKPVPGDNEPLTDLLTCMHGVGFALSMISNTFANQDKSIVLLTSFQEDYPVSMEHETKAHAVHTTGPSQLERCCNFGYFS